MCVSSDAEFHSHAQLRVTHVHKSTCITHTHTCAQATDSYTCAQTYRRSWMFQNHRCVCACSEQAHTRYVQITHMRSRVEGRAHLCPGSQRCTCVTALLQTYGHLHICSHSLSPSEAHLSSDFPRLIATCMPLSSDTCTYAQTPQGLHTYMQCHGGIHLHTHHSQVNTGPHECSQPLAYLHTQRYTCSYTQKDTHTSVDPQASHMF